MRYYSYDEYVENGDTTITVSEDEIRKEFFPYWYKKMCIKYEQAYVDEHYCFEDCLEDWMIIHYAREVKS
jgi:hypothetical protein